MCVCVSITTTTEANVLGAASGNGSFLDCLYTSIRASVCVCVCATPIEVQSIN